MGDFLLIFVFAQKGRREKNVKVRKLPAQVVSG